MYECIPRYRVLKIGQLYNGTVIFEFVDFVYRCMYCKYVSFRFVHRMMNINQKRWRDETKLPETSSRKTKRRKCDTKIDEETSHRYVSPEERLVKFCAEPTSAIKSRMKRALTEKLYLVAVEEVRD